MTEDLIKTKKIIIVDNDDKTRMELRTDSKGNPQIVLRDSFGNPSINLSLDDKNKPSLTLNASNSMIPGVDLEGKAMSSSQLTLCQEGTNMALFIGSGIHGSRIAIRIGENNESNLLLIDQNNSLKVAVTSNFRGHGDIIIYKDNNPIAALSQII